MSTVQMFVMCLAHIALFAMDPLDEQFQIQCMNALVSLETIEATSRQITRREMPFAVARNAVCQWCGIECVDGTVDKINWPFHFFQVESFDWFPPGLRAVQIVVQKKVIKYLRTQRLPRRLQFCCLDLCSIHGSVDFTTLPEGLEVLILTNNNISGNVRLTRLPQQIRVIDIGFNPIGRCFVENAKLPASLGVVRVCKTAGTVKLVAHGGKTADKRVRNTSAPLALTTFDEFQ
ncbi:leucine-rich repeat protein [Perkinsela sp. CCAP 1560/4]|nr:leucine-rich repeat protein [Perkinsela sp. CCAP 1560/4]|eukprot:KNH07184.1 leucine-rich repeat protein [Perkinsela sp. CCAP 1560/4]